MRRGLGLRSFHLGSGAIPILARGRVFLRILLLCCRNQLQYTFLITGTGSGTVLGTLLEEVITAFSVVIHPFLTEVTGSAVCQFASAGFGTKPSMASRIEDNTVRLLE